MPKLDTKMHDTQIAKSCSTSCPSGQYNKGCAGTHSKSKGQCVDCTFKAGQNNHYFAGDGDLADDCPTKECVEDRCPVRRGHDSSGRDGSCRPYCNLCLSVYFVIVSVR